MSEMKDKDLEKEFFCWKKIGRDDYSDELKDDIYKHPGNYAIAIDSSGIMEGKEFQFKDEGSKIVYFGMTNSREGFRGRLKQFYKTIHDCKGKPQHGGACRFCSNADDLKKGGAK